MPLNPSQLRAIEKTEGPCLIIAGAGTGKTLTIVEKLAFLVKKGNDPTRILALTFSNEAASNMKRKAEEICPEAREMHISTFHSFCADFIRNHSRRCKVKESFNILEEPDAAILLKRELDLDPGTAKHYANTISKAKDLDIGIGEYEKYLKEQEKKLEEFHPKAIWQKEYDGAIVRLRTMHLDEPEDKEEKKEQKEEKSKLAAFIDLYDNYEKYTAFIEAWKAYEKKKKDLNALDYADLNKIVLEYAETYGSHDLAESYDYIVVDEFQDTNKVQFELLRHLTASKKNITVVGDQNQTIYAFRGAYADNVAKFRMAFALGEKDIIKLKENYRSTNAILRTAHKVIRNNYENADDCLLLESSKDGENVRIIQTIDNKEQARRVVEEIEKLAGKEIGYKNIAVLYRSHSSGTAIKMALKQRGLPYSTAGGAEFFHRPEVKTPVAFLYVLSNFSEPLMQADVAWWRLLHTVYGLSARDSTRIAEFKKEKRRDGISLQKILYEHLEKIELTDHGKRAIESLMHDLDNLREKTNRRLSDLILEIYETRGLARRYSHERSADNAEALMNLRELHKLAEKFETFHGADLADFIIYLELIDEMGGGFPSAQILEENSIKLMTIHAAKGLEFKAVFLIDLVEDKFPLTRGGVEPLIPEELNEQYADVLKEGHENEKDREKAIKEKSRGLKEREERRLAYVALTRSMNMLILTLAKDYGGKEERKPSKFLTEMRVKEEWFSTDKAEEGDLMFEADKETKAALSSDTDLDRIAAQRKSLMLQSIDSKKTEESLFHLLVYQGMMAGKPIEDHTEAGKKAANEVKDILNNIKENCARGMKFNPEALRFSVTGMKSFKDCPKRYEMKEILQMPSRDDEGEGSMAFGSFIHDVLEVAGKEKIKTKEELMEIMKSMANGLEEEDKERARKIMDVFWERNKEDIKYILDTEKFFTFQMNGFTFTGRIDRIDDLGNKKVRIVDYKTGYVSYDIPKDDREMQLLLYALAVQEDSLLKKNGWMPEELVLDMLEKEKPIIFNLENGIMSAPGTRIKSSSIEDIKQQVVEIAKEIAKDYEQGFPVAETDQNCKRCSYKLYCPKWG